MMDVPVQDDNTIKFKPIHETYKFITFFLSSGCMYPNPRNIRSRIIIMGIILAMHWPIYILFTYEGYLCAISKDIDTITRHFTIFVPMIYGNMEMIQCIVRRKEFEELFKIINRDYLSYNYVPQDYQQLAKENIERTKKFEMFLTVILVLTTNMFPLVAIASMIHSTLFSPEPKRFMVHEIRMFFFTDEETYKSPFFECYFVYNCILVGLVIQVFVGYDGMFMVVMQHACLKLQMCGHKMSHFFDKPNDIKAINRNIVNMVQEQYETFKFIDIIQRNYEMWLIQLFVLSGLQAVTIMYVLAITKITELDPRYPIFFIGLISYLGVPCYVSSEVKAKAEDLADQAYSSGWESVPDTSIRRSLSIIIARARRPIELTAFKMFAFNMELLASILRTAYSVCTLLRNSKA